MSTYVGAPGSRGAEIGRSAAGLARRLDWTLVASVAALCAIGSLRVWSATIPGDGSDPLESTEHLTRHLLRLALEITSLPTLLLPHLQLRREALRMERQRSTRREEMSRWMNRLNQRRLRTH